MAFEMLHHDTMKMVNRNVFVGIKLTFAT